MTTTNTDLIQAPFGFGSAAAAAAAVQVADWAGALDPLIGNAAVTLAGLARITGFSACLPGRGAAS
jgi:hypothetical protein